MSSPTTPTHGKLGAIYRVLPEGFKGPGLNDLTWGTGYSGGASAYFEVVIDGLGTPDTFMWRKDGGAWTEDVAITGEAQTLSDGQTITFAATTGHTAAAAWSIGNLKDEPCAESGAEAQITASTRRILNANAVPTFTDAGGKNVVTVQLVSGKAVFDGNVGEVTVTGNKGYIPRSILEKIGYLFDWSFDLTLDLAEINRMGQQWKEYVPGQAGGSGRAEAYFIGGLTLFDGLKKTTEGTGKYFYVELYNYDPDGDMTGDRFIAWAAIKDVNINAPVNEVVKEPITFDFLGMPAFVANV